MSASRRNAARRGAIAVALAAAVAGGAASTAAAQSSRAEREPQLVRMIPAGDDGDRAYYKVSCKHDDPGSVVVTHSDAQMCATPYGREPKCDREWSLREAGEYACKPPGRS